MIMFSTLNLQTDKLENPGTGSQKLLLNTWKSLNTQQIFQSGYIFTYSEFRLNVRCALKFSWLVIVTKHYPSKPEMGDKSSNSYKSALRQQIEDEAAKHIPEAPIPVSVFNSKL